MLPASGKYQYSRIPQLNDLIVKVKTSHDRMLNEKRNELLDIVQQCMGEIHQAGNGDSKVKTIIERSDTYYTQQKEKIAETTSLALMEGYPIPMWNYRDETVSKIEGALEPVKPVEPTKPVSTENTASKKKYKPIFRQSLLKAARLESEAEIDVYVDKLREQLKTLLKGSDGIELK